MGRESYATYVRYVTNPDANDKDIAAAYNRGEDEARRTVEAVWAVNRARCDATRRMHETAAALGPSGARARALLRGDGGKGSREKLSSGLRGGLAAYSVLSKYPAYIRAVAKHDGDVFDIEGERDRFERMCSTCRRLADEMTI